MHGVPFSSEHEDGRATDTIRHLFNVVEFTVLVLLVLLPFLTNINYFNVSHSEFSANLSSPPISQSQKLIYIDNPWFSTQSSYPNVVWSKTISTKTNISGKLSITTLTPMGPDSHYPPAEVLQAAIDAHHFKLMKLKDVYAFEDNTIFADNTFFTFQTKCTKYYPSINFTSITSFVRPVQSFDSVLLVTSRFGDYYAHWINNILPALTIVPSEVISKSAFIVREVLPFTYDSLRLFGITRENVFKIYPGEAIFAKSLYTISPVECVDFHPLLISRLRNMTVDKVGLDLKPAFRCVIYQRDKSVRSITNYKAIFDMAQKHWPNIKWEMGSSFSSFADNARYFNEVKMIFMVHGGALANVIFMQPGSVVAEIMASDWISQYIYLSAFSGVHYVTARASYIPWYSESTRNLVPIKIARTLIETSLKLANFP